MRNPANLAKLLGLGLAVFAVASCGTSDAPNALNSLNSVTEVNMKCLGDLDPLERSEPTLPIALESATGQLVTITSVDRVVTIAPGSAEIVWALGLGDQIVGKDLVSVYPDADQVPTVNPGHEVSIETVLSLKPSLVIADNSEENSDSVEKLTELGIPVVAVPDASSVTEISPRIVAIAKALGVSSAGDQLADRTNEMLQQVESTSSSEMTIAFLYLRGNAGIYLLGGKGSGADSIISALGAKDSGTQLGIDGFAPLTAESLAKANPDVLMVMNEGLESVGGIEKLLALPGVSSTTAAQNSAVIQADDRVLLAFGPQTPSVISCLAAQLANFSETA